MKKSKQSDFLSQNERFWKMLPLLYFPAATLSHDWVSNVYTYIFKQFGRMSMEWAVHWGSVTLLGTLSASAFLYMKQARTFHARDLLIWGLTLPLLYGINQFLICTNIERIHFPQYALLAFLLKITIKDDAFILCLCALGGIFDEWLQFVMHPKYTGYLDFNDFILNLAGAVLGLLIFGVFKKEPNDDPSSHTKKLKSLTRRTGLALSLLLIAGYFSERIIPYVPMPDDPQVFMSIDGKMRMVVSFLQPSGFWEVTEYGRRYHILSPLEGTVLLVLLLFFFGRLFSWSRSAQFPFFLFSPHPIASWGARFVRWCRCRGSSRF